MLRHRLLRTFALLSAGERARREHSAWLTRALNDPRRRFPRIPTRPVREGGFAPITRTPQGRAWADQWWGGTLEGLD